MNARKIGATLVALGLTLGLVGAGVSASYTDDGSASENIHVGTFDIEISSTASNAVVVNQLNPSLHTVTLPVVEILSSAAGNAPLPFAIKNIGSIGGTVSVTMTAPPAPFTSMLLAPVTDVYLPPNETANYAGGIAWPMLVNANLDKAATITYSAIVNEGMPPASVVAPSKVDQACGATTGSIIIPAAAHINYFVNGTPKAPGTFSYAAGTYAVTAAAQAGFRTVGYPAGGWSLTIAAIPCPPSVQFVGVASANSNSASLPAGWQSGDMAVVMAMNPSSNTIPANPAGWTSLSTVTTGTNNMASHLGSRRLVAGDTTTGSWTSATRVLILVYRNVASIGNFNFYAQSNTQAYVTVPGISPLQVTNGTSWVASLGACKTGTCKGASFGNGINVVTRTAGAPSNSMLGADTNGGVSTWAPHVSSGGNSPSNGFSVELKAAP